MKTDIRILFGLRVRELREAQGYTQENFANSIDMARTYYAEIEGGKRNVALVNIRKIADGLGVTLSELFTSDMF